METTSEALLTQIMLLIQSLHQDITLFDQRVIACEAAVVDNSERINNLIRNAFPNGDYESHKEWHAHRHRGRLRNWIIRVLS